MIYSKFEIHPQNGLNLVFGPNGCGKVFLNIFRVLF